MMSLKDRIECEFNQFDETGKLAIVPVNDFGFTLEGALANIPLALALFEQGHIAGDDVIDFCIGDITYGEYLRIIEALLKIRGDVDWDVTYNWEPHTVFVNAVVDPLNVEYTCDSLRSKIEHIKTYDLARRLVKIGRLSPTIYVWGEEDDNGVWVGKTNEIDSFLESSFTEPLFTKLIASLI